MDTEENLKLTKIIIESAEDLSKKIADLNIDFSNPIWQGLLEEAIFTDSDIKEVILDIFNKSFKLPHSNEKPMKIKDCDVILKLNVKLP